MRSLKETSRTLWSSVFLALIVIGITGLSWDAFKDDGWVERRIGDLWGDSFRHPIIIAPIVVGTIFAAYTFLHGGLAPGRSRRSAQILIYVFVTAGLYYSYKWFVS